MLCIFLFIYKKAGRVQLGYLIPISSSSLPSPTPKERGRPPHCANFSTCNVLRGSRSAEPLKLARVANRVGHCTRNVGGANRFCSADSRVYYDDATQLFATSALTLRRPEGQTVVYSFSDQKRVLHANAL